MTEIANGRLVRLEIAVVVSLECSMRKKEGIKSYLCFCINDNVVYMKECVGVRLRSGALHGG